MENLNIVGEKKRRKALYEIRDKDKEMEIASKIIIFSLLSVFLFFQKWEGESCWESRRQKGKEEKGK